MDFKVKELLFHSIRSQITITFFLFFSVFFSFSFFFFFFFAMTPGNRTKNAQMYTSVSLVIGHIHYRLDTSLVESHGLGGPMGTETRPLKDVCENGKVLVIRCK